MSSLSAGYTIYRLLSDSEEVRSAVTKIFPVVTDKAVLPYIAYRRAGISVNPLKTGSSADTIEMDVAVYAATYEESVSLAEKVRRALDFRQLPEDAVRGVRLRSCTFTGAGTETFEGDAFVQYLKFTLKL